MSINNSNKEALFNLYLAKCGKGLIEDTTSLKMDGILLEYYFEGRKIDIFTKNDAMDIYVECQLSPADKVHEKEIISIINKVENNKSCAILWLATAFKKDNMIEEIIQLIKKENKKVDFFCVLVNPEVIQSLEELNKVHTFTAVQQLQNKLSIDNLLVLYYKYITYSTECVNDSSREKVQTIRSITNKQIIDEIRQDTKFINFYNERKEMDVNYLQFGAGKQGIDMLIAFFGKEGDSYVAVRFSKENTEIFDYLQQRQKILEEKLGQQLCFLDNRIIAHIDKDEHRFRKIDLIAQLSNKFINYIINYTMYWDNPEMWKQHPEGVLE